MGETRWGKRRGTVWKSGWDHLVKTLKLRTNICNNNNNNNSNNNTLPFHLDNFVVSSVLFQDKQGTGDGGAEIRIIYTDIFNAYIYMYTHKLNIIFWWWVRIHSCVKYTLSTPLSIDWTLHLCVCVNSSVYGDFQTVWFCKIVLFWTLMCFTIFYLILLYIMFTILLQRKYEVHSTVAFNVCVYIYQIV